MVPPTLTGAWPSRSPAAAVAEAVAAAGLAVRRAQAPSRPDGVPFKFHRAVACRRRPPPVAPAGAARRVHAGLHDAAGGSCKASASAKSGRDGKRALVGSDPGVDVPLPLGRRRATSPWRLSPNRRRRAICCDRRVVGFGGAASLQRRDGAIELPGARVELRQSRRACRASRQRAASATRIVPSASSGAPRLPACWPAGSTGRSSQRWPGSRPSTHARAPSPGQPRRAGDRAADSAPRRLTATQRAPSAAETLTMRRTLSPAARLPWPTHDATILLDDITASLEMSSIRWNR